MSKPYSPGKLQYTVVLVLCLWSYFIILIESCKFEDLPVVAHAHITENGTEFAHGRGVAYKCETGYKVANGTNRAVCLNQDGILHWVPPTFSCVLEDCGDPPDLFHAEKGQVQGRVAPYPVGSKATYSCLSGYYKYEGTDTADCIRDSDGKVKWTRPSLDCKAEHCGDPGQVKNAERNGHLFTHPNSVTYVCDRGYSTTDKTVLYCLPGGQWSDRLPVCEKVQCPDLENPANGLVKHQETTYQSVSVYSCSQGYRLEGDRERHCTGSGSWSGSQPICKEVHCPSFTVSPGTFIVHGQNTGRPGDLVIMKCNHSPERKTLKCTDSGEWSTSPLVCDVPITPSFEAEPTKTTGSTTQTTAVEHSKCEYPGDINHGSLVESQQDIIFPTSINLTFRCDPGYKLNGQSTLQCLPTGEWDPSRLPACVKLIPISIIVGVTVGILLAIIIAVVFGLYIRKRKRKAQDALCLKRKANSIDARDIEETRCLERDKKPIPVTSL